MTANRQPELYAAALIPYAAASVALVLRMVARRTTRMPFVWEDYLAAVAHMIGTAFTALSLIKMRWGLGKHIADLGLNDTNKLLHDYHLELFVDMWLYTFSVGLSKIVILGFYWRMFSRSFIRQPIRILFAGSALWIIARTVVSLMICRPIQSFWDPHIVGECPMEPMTAIYALSIPHLVLEVAILLCPLIQIWRLHLAMPKKLAVAAMFASGLLVCGSALGTIIHTVQLAHMDSAGRADITWNSTDDQIWAVCDVNFASFATSLPLLRPIFRSCTGIFSGLKSTGISNHDRTPTYGTAPTHRTRMRTRKMGDSDSVIEFADDGAGSSKSIELKDVTPMDSDGDVERQGGIMMRTDMLVDFREALR